MLVRSSGVVVAVLTCSVAAGCSNKLSGTARTSTKETGEFSLTPDSCHSGEHESFFGVELADGKSGNLLRIVKSATGDYEVVVKLPKSDNAAHFTRGSCSKFEVGVERQSSRINDIWNVEGKLVAECAAGDATFSANLTFENCH